MYISVVIPTYRRKNEALNAMRSFYNQSHKNFELLVVDQGPDFISPEEISELRSSFTIKYLRLNEAGLTRARNEAIKNAAGDIILFCDDDIVADNLLVEKHIENYRDATIGGVAGRIISVGRRKHYKSLYPKIGTFNPFNARPICNFHLERRCDVKHAKGCNMSFRKDLLIAAGLFDESLKGTANREDADMAFRIRRLGYRMVFEPKAALKHLELAYGGCQVKNFNDLVYWLYFSDTLLFLRYFRKAFLPFFFGWLSLRIFYFAALKADAGIIIYAKNGFSNAVKQYRRERKGRIGPD